jgi:hypothetical protein
METRLRQLLKSFERFPEVRDLPGVEVRGSEQSNDAYHSHDNCAAPSIHCKVRNAQCFVRRNSKREILRPTILYLEAYR